MGKFVLPLTVKEQSCHCTRCTVFSLLVPSAGQLLYCITHMFMTIHRISTDEKRELKVISRLYTLQKIRKHLMEKLKFVWRQHSILPMTMSCCNSKPWKVKTPFCISPNLLTTRRLHWKGVEVVINLEESSVEGILPCSFVIKLQEKCTKKHLFIIYLTAFTSLCVVNKTSLEGFYFTCS